MKFYKCTSFTGHYPVGVSAIVCAKSIGLACVLLEQELKQKGLEQKIERDQLEEVKLQDKSVIILNDGDY